MSKPFTRRGLLGAGLAGASVATLGAALAPRAVGLQSRDDEQASARGGGLPGHTPHTRFAVNIETWFQSLPFAERLDAAADLGFSAVEFWGTGDKDLDALAARAQARGVLIAQFTAWGFRPGLNDPRNHDAFLAAVERAVEIAQLLGAPMATVVGGDDQPGMSLAQMHENIRVGLQRAAPLAEAGGLTLILEPMNIRVDHMGHCLYGSPAAVEICRAVNSPNVKLNWDLYHMQISEGDLCGRLADGFDQVGYLQLADHPGRNEPGTGEIHYPRVLRAAHELGYRGPVGLECWPRDDDLSAAWRVNGADQW